MRKPAQEISQVLLPYRAICGIRIMRDRLLGASSRDYMWPGELAVGSRERPDVAGIVWKVGSGWTNVAGAPPSIVDPRGSQRRATKAGGSTVETDRELGLRPF